LNLQHVSATIDVTAAGINQSPHISRTNCNHPPTKPSAKHNQDMGALRIELRGNKSDASSSEMPWFVAGRDPLLPGLVSHVKLRVWRGHLERKLGLLRQLK